MKVLFAASEVSPLVKTGGLADVTGSLPIELMPLGVEIRVAMPAYRGIAEQLQSAKPIGHLTVPGTLQPVTLISGRLRSNGPAIVLIDAPELFDRDGGPYTYANGQDFPDNALRFAVFSRAVAALALGQGPDGWRPDVVHCNDWQTGLVPALLARELHRPATVFTIHNLAYQGLFDASEFSRLQLPPELWDMNGLEFYGRMSLIKGGIAFADVMTTVSPTYASEICTSSLGYGLRGMLSYRQDRLFGVLNGIDTDTWNPATDPLIAQTYDSNSLIDKRVNTRRLLQTFGLPYRDDALVFGHIGRLVEQKGIDLILAVLPRLLEQSNIKLVVLGSGDAQLESALQKAAERMPNQVGVLIGYDEPLAHLIEAGADVFLAPSRFEPCGLNQMYSLRYGTIPVVTRTGGFADTVIDATSGALLDGTANGFVCGHANTRELWETLERLLELHAKPRVHWKKMQLTGMASDFSWRNSAAKYRDLYLFAMEHSALH